MSASLESFERGLIIVAGYLRMNKYELLFDLMKIITAYFVCNDEFYSKDKGKHMEIITGSNNTKVSKTYTNHESIFGCTVIKEGIFTWRIRVNKLNYPHNCWHIYVGVINISIQSMKNIYSHPERSGCYTFDTTFGRVAKESYTLTPFTIKVTKVGDIMDLILDLNKHTLHCKINGVDCGAHIDKLPKGHYRLLVSLYFDSTEVELL